MQDKRRLSYIFIKRKQRGAVAVVVAITLTGVMAMMGLAVDTGNMLAQRDRLQNMANAAALSAAKSHFFPNETYNAPEANALATIQAMGGNTESLNIDISAPKGGSTDLSGRFAVSISETVSPILLGLAGVGDTTLTATAVAGPAPEPAYSVAPIMACTNNLGNPGPADTNDPQIYHFLESFLDDTDLENVVGFRMFIDTTGFEQQVLNMPLLYEITSVMLGSGENVLMYEDTPTRVVDEFGYDSWTLRPGTMLNTRLGITNFGNDVFSADYNSTFSSQDELACADCRERDAFSRQFRPKANIDGKVEFFQEYLGLLTEILGRWGREVAIADYPYIYADYLQDNANQNMQCNTSECETNRRILKMPVAPSCGVEDLDNKEFACFFMLEPARVFIDDVDEERGWTNIDLEYRTEFIAQHIPCPAITNEEKISGAYDVVLYDGPGS
ncbi:pilus assembly protein TadG-related protein [Salinisphaera sp. G21_0]|uniref:pilus assembly protein TadG-related protein n=1 Tax=Salinisphaera sp. G21_0 TaxID=2821094 RepID=UPI001ADA5ADC|nr:pilus assembly protein TadG-related protein [Salinisphaera sp. G21_0]MBO9481537.1 hypothetical protein [Salinisphaera sp. G21_0]